MIIAAKKIPRYEGWKVTNEEYMQLEDDGFKYDMIDGVLHMAPSPFLPHMDYAGELFFRMKVFITNRNLGKIYQEVDVHLPDAGDVLRPDISVVLNENKNILKKWIMGTPDLVCEVLSESTRNNDLVRKANRYLANEVKEYWIVETENKWIEVWYNRGATWEKISGQSILKSEILNGFNLDSIDFFRVEE